MKMSKYVWQKNTNQSMKLNLFTCAKNTEKRQYRWLICRYEMEGNSFIDGIVLLVAIDETCIWSYELKLKQAIYEMTCLDQRDSRENWVICVWLINYHCFWHGRFIIVPSCSDRWNSQCCVLQNILWWTFETDTCENGSRNKGSSW